jgi:hypothetical protein
MLESKNTHREAGLADNKEKDPGRETEAAGKNESPRQANLKSKNSRSNRRAKIFSNKVGG